MFFRPRQGHKYDCLEGRQWVAEIRENIYILNTKKRPPVNLITKYIIS